MSLKKTPIISSTPAAPASPGRPYSRTCNPPAPAPSPGTPSNSGGVQNQKCPPVPIYGIQVVGTSSGDSNLGAGSPPQYTGGGTFVYTIIGYLDPCS